VVVRDVTKWLVKQRLNGNSATVAAAKQSALLQLAEVAADCRGRNFQAFSELQDRDLTSAQQLLENQLSTSLSRRGFFGH
jgi:hypothetical protein